MGGDILKLLWKVSNVDQFVMTQNEAIFDEILQLTHVPGKRVTHEDLHDCRRNTGDALAPLRVEPLHEMLDKKGNIFASLFERRQSQTNDGKTEI
jgi:hypothetical protein